VNIIDSHVHLKHGDAEGTEYAPEVIVDVMDAVGIDRAVVFAMSTTTSRSIEMAKSAADRYPDRLIPYVYALPAFRTEVLSEIDTAIAQMGFRGVKIHAAECRLADYVVGPVLELAAGHGVPCLIDFSGDARAAEKLARGFPNTRLIVAHMGRYLCTDARLIDRFMGIAERHRNVFLDVSGVVLTWKIQQAVRRFGSGRVLFGTDGPHPYPDVVTFARTELAKIEMLELSTREKEDVLGRSVGRLIG